jgi:hypothetical protein
VNKRHPSVEFLLKHFCPWLWSPLCHAAAVGKYRAGKKSAIQSTMSICAFDEMKLFRIRLLFEHV